MQHGLFPKLVIRSKIAARGPVRNRERGELDVEALGCELTAGGTIVTDGDGRTAVAGVYAAGDAATERLRSVAAAIGTGSRAALAVALDHVAVVAVA
jgi:alkyl hydroperoxide reductase subunit AhpF